MKLLVIGGTIFLGRHIVDHAVRAGDDVTIFTRGEHNPDLFPGARKLRGDRRKDLSALQGETWDAVIDTCGYFPRDVRSATRLLADAVQRYTFISSLSVYSDNEARGLREDGACGTLDDPDGVEEITEHNYGPLKFHCEQAAEEEMPGRTMRVRAGLIVGPWDPSDRFTYWPTRIARGGRVVAPGRPGRPVQFIDVRDLATWVVEATRRGVTGVFNAIGPVPPVTMGDVLASCLRVSGSGAELVWVDDGTLQRLEVGPWIEMPLWIPEHEGMDGFNTTDASKAIDAGLSFRSVDETVGAILEWNAQMPNDRPMRAGLAPQREADVLAKALVAANGQP